MTTFRLWLPFLFLATISRAQLASPLTAPPVPENLGLGLRELVELSQTSQAGLQQQIQTAPAINSDAAGRVVANVHLDGKVPLAAVQANLVALGLEVIAVEDHWRNGVISVRLPLAAAAAVANLPGVRSITLARRPVRRVGAVTAESSVVEHAAEVNTPGIMTPQGIIGRNISIGIVSDSFDGAANVPRASAGVASGDLPGPGNPDGYTQPVVILKDDNGADATDEGRGMAEIVHDIAPAAKISFSTCGATQSTMAAAIRSLRTSSASLCDIIVDDIGFADEPFFSDGIISQAVDDVVTSNTLPGKKVVFFSASGNTDNHGYDATAHIVSVALGVSSSVGFVKMNQVPSSLYAGGFQNLNPNSTPFIVMSVTTDSDPGELVLQWDDPFNTGGVTTDYNLLVFDAAGNYLSSVSGRDNNFATSEPVEIVDLNPNTTYQLVISLASANPPTATHLRMISFGQGVVTGPYFGNKVISLFGHPAAANANAVAAYVYDNTPNVVSNYNPNHTNPPPGPYAPAIESFDALGGNLPFYFDSQGNRLASPQIRQKPEFAAADGVDTSFFPPDDGADSDNDGFPNFFGTSAAAPNAAAIAALLLEAAGGPQSLTPQQVRDKLQQSTLPHDLDLNFSRATIKAGNSSLDLSASGDDSNDSATNPSFFTLQWDNGNGVPLQQVTIDLTHTALVFDPRSDVGFPFTVGPEPEGVSITSSLSADLRVLTLNFGNFTPGKSIRFGIDRDYAGINAGGNSADALGGVSVTAVADPKAPLFTAFNNQLGHGFSPTDGQGLLDAKLAVETIVGHKSTFNGASVNLSTRGNVSTGDDVLIGGLIIDNSATKNIIIRALGPSVPVSGTLPDPTLELRDQNGGLITSNDNWQDDPVQASQIQATGIPPTDPRESAIVKSLAAGSYTAIVRGANSATGIGLVEVYDLDSQPAASHLANIATRGFVHLNDNVLIAGFILQQGTSQVVVRAIGPSVFALAPATPSALADPSLELRDSQGNLQMSNDNWQEDSFQAVELSAVGLAPTSPVESAFLATLPSGSYTAIVRGAHGTTGNAVVEVYNVR